MTKICIYHARKPLDVCRDCDGLKTRCFNYVPNNETPMYEVTEIDGFFHKIQTLEKRTSFTNDLISNSPGTYNRANCCNEGSDIK